jgi:phosphotransferase system HPr-like phosphotransfer protein
MQVQTAMIIGYGKITRKEVRKEVRQKVEPVKGGSRIEVQSAGFKHGNFATINIQGEMLVNHDSSQRGLNVVALDPFKHELLLNSAYDTYGDAKASGRFVKDFKKLPKGAVIVIGVKDDASKRLSGEAKEVIKSLGSEEILNLGFKQGFAFIGVKGQIKFLEKRGDIVGTGAILSYAVVERKRQTRTKVDGGSSIEIISAGAKDGNLGKIMLNGKEVLTATNAHYLVPLEGATMSSNYRKGDVGKEASIALDADVNTNFHTKCGADEWWSAQFQGRFLVSEVQIANRATGPESSIRRLQKAEVTIEGQYCGTLPDNTPE